MVKLEVSSRIVLVNVPAAMTVVIMQIFLQSVQFLQNKLSITVYD
jgi:hypothetical protein